jgi:hypothetical protein
MKTPWFELAIYLDGIRHFEACRTKTMPVAEMLQRLQFVHDNIEHCFAEGRLIDRNIFDELDDAQERLKRKDLPDITEVMELAERMATRYGLDADDPCESGWMKKDRDGRFMIWIDQRKTRLL